jgi:hypothetical protein
MTYSSHSRDAIWFLLPTRLQRNEDDALKQRAALK